jgi:four helix bundle protein
VNYKEWLTAVPAEIQEDSLWKMEAYRLALFAADLGWHDVTKLLSDKRTIELSSQLYRALGSISANIAEGYSRGTGRDRARFYEYALGSGRESRGWYYKGRHVLAGKVVQHRFSLLTEIIKLLLRTVPNQRGEVLREEGPEYGSDIAEPDLTLSSNNELRSNLLENVPVP